MALPLKAFERHRPTLVPSADVGETADDITPDIYRQLFTSLDVTTSTRPVIGVTSAIAGEGRTTIAAGLARTLAHDLDVMVSLVEVDLEHPTLAHRLDIPSMWGLADVLEGRCVLQDVRWLVAPNLFAIPAGIARGNPASLLRQFVTNDPFHTGSQASDFVVLDLPPLLGRGYSPVAARAADALVLVIRAGVTPMHLVQEAVTRLDDRLPNGVVFNGARSPLPAWWPEDSRRGVPTKQ